jgi:uncharacterized membrane protein
MLNFLSNYFVSPGYLLILIVLIFILLIMRKTNKILFFTRIIILILLVIAVSEPYSPFSIFGGGSSKLEILEDESNSYSLFGENIGEKVYANLERVGGVKYNVFGEEIISNVGDRLIESMKEGSNVLLLSDGNINYGEGLEKVREVAIIENLSISLIKKSPVEDYGVSISGPSKVGPNTKAIFSVVVSGTDNKERNVVLTVDGKEVLSGSAGVLEYETKFDGGYHQIVAKLENKDFFEENNIYYKSVKVVEKQKVLLFGDEGSPLHKVLSQLYDVEVGGLYGLNKYHTVVIDDKPIEEFSDKVSSLKKYVEEGNGLIVIGGKDSFEHGDYSESKFEDLLPVKVSGVGKKEGNVNVVVLIDISSSTGANYGIGTAADAAKALAISVLENIDPVHNLGVVAFAGEGVVVEELGLLDDKDIGKLKSKISNLEPEGSTNVGKGVESAIKMVEGKSGGKNIILISDGQTQGDIGPALIDAQKENIKIYTVGVGNSAKELLERISSTTGGEYYHAIQSHQLVFVFGDPESKKSEGEGIKIYDTQHFITDGVIADARVYGTNDVVPKSSAELLITSSGSQPLLSVWRRGLGRIAVLSVDNGNFWAGEMYTGIDSRMISRTINWGAGDAERKKNYFFSVNDPRVKTEFELIVKGEKPPKISGIKFEKKGDGTYVAINYVENAGFFEFEDDEYGVNHNSEYDALGINSELENIVLESGGEIFNEGDGYAKVVNVMKEKANVLNIEKELFIWPFISLAIVIFLLEVWFRNIRERKNI